MIVSGPIIVFGLMIVFGMVLSGASTHPLLFARPAPLCKLGNRLITICGVKSRKCVCFKEIFNASL
ncbi:hypothetical protein GCM10007854_09480 [Algimonas porphyrae]|uniref:Secreted protein n=1 Tax=Algimonas porphyrae TaxID=1128113 RepID=A0ABQ5UXX1_9PROT|nr:hypothetical protein GCM10007854_09480 [Algimonas porphyrae]